MRRLFVNRVATVNNAPHRTVIRANQPWWRIDWKAIVEYRDLLWLLVRRDFVAIYKQTILGPLWFIIQPLATTLVFTVIFGRLAKISTDDLPPFLFYMCGTVLWTYFQACFDGVAISLTENAGLFGKVYFPRLIPPLAIVINNLARFGLNLGMFIIFWLYFVFFTSENINPNIYILILPLLVFQCAALGLGMGLWLSAMTAKYRDLRFALPFLAQLWMYATPVVWPTSNVPPNYQWLLGLNPMAGVVEFNRYAFLGEGTVLSKVLLLNLIITVGVLITGVLVYNRSQRTFIDTI